MRKLIRKHSKFIVVLIGIAMILPMLIINTPGIEAKTQMEPNSDDIRIASDISNTTGVDVEEILKLKALGKTWNEILDILKNKDKNRNKEDKIQRNNALVKSGIGEDYVDKLKEEGYLEEEIMETKLLVERTIFQLNEIAKTDVSSTKLPNEEAKANKDEDTSNYIKTLEKIELKPAVYWILKLKNDFNSIERAFDEYLYALQLDVSLEEYFIDQKEYQKQIDEKRISMGYENIITLAKIEEKMLEKLQNNNMQNRDFIGRENNIEIEAPEAENESSLPEVPKPSIEDVKPVSPNEEIMKEIEIINPNNN